MVLDYRYNINSFCMYGVLLSKIVAIYAIMSIAIFSKNTPIPHGA